MSERPQVHQLKTWPMHFDNVIDGTKTFELRKDDRGFNKGDILILREWARGAYSGRWCVATVKHIVRGEWLADGCVAMGIRVVDHG